MYRKFSLAPIFTDGMVLQRDRSIPVWGSAPEGNEVTVEFLGQKVKTTAAAGGSWRADLAPVGAGGPYRLTASCASVELVCDDVLVGEVWIAGGQSNMEYALISSRHGFQEIPKADYPAMRFYAVPRITHENLPEDPAADAANEALTKGTRWQACTPQTAGAFYAVAFHFAKELHKTLDVPVGIIECAWGGTSASCWMSEEALAGDDETKLYWDEYIAHLQGLAWETYEQESMQYAQAIEAYNRSIEGFPVTPEDMDAYFESISAMAYPWPPPMGCTSPLRPCGLYRTMFRKVVPYGVKGVIFYQGESDTHRPALYGRLFRNMMENWRQDLESPDLPFLITQLAAFGNENPTGLEYALLREQQALLGKDRHAGLAMTMDCGHPTNIHPLDKKTVGERLAAQAKARIYGLDVPCQGPEFKSMTVQGGKAILSFSHVYSGLVLQGDELKGFQLAGADRRFLPAQAVIEGDQVVVSAEGIEEPQAVRYGFTNYMEVNLHNAQGFAALPFRSDDWL